MRKISTTFFAVALALFVQQANAAVVDVTMTQRIVTSEEAGAAVDTAPTDGVVYEFWVTSDADILSVNKIDVANADKLFQFSTVPTDVNSPNLNLVGTFPSITADSYITTPGAGTATTGGFSTADSSWFDTTVDGAVAGFQFAQLTFSKDDAADMLFSGRISVTNSSGAVENVPFSFQAVPEPTSILLAGLGMIGFIAKRRRS